MAVESVNRAGASALSAPITHLSDVGLASEVRRESYKCRLCRDAGIPCIVREVRSKYRTETGIQREVTTSEFTMCPVCHPK